MNVTVEQILNFKFNAEAYIADRPGVFSKFIYALNRSLKNIKEAYDSYQDEYTKARFDLALKDEKTKHILKDGNDFAFDGVGRTALASKNKDLLKKQVDVDVFQVGYDDIPNETTVTFLDVMCPFVVTQESIEQKFLDFEKLDNKQP